MNYLTPEQRAAKWGTAAKIIALGILGFIVAPFVGLAIEGLLGLIIIGLIGGTSLWILPWVEMKAANIRLQMIKGEAAKHPIETLQNESLRQKNLLDDRLEKIKMFSAKTGTFASKLDGFKRDYPEEAPKFDETLSQMKQLLALRERQYKQAMASWQLFNKAIDKASAIWDMGKAAIEATSGTKMSDDDFFAKIKINTSLDAVTDQMNLAVSELDTSLLEDNEPAIPVSAVKALPAPAGNVIDIQVAPIAAHAKHRMAE